MGSRRTATPPLKRAVASARRFATHARELAQRKRWASQLTIAEAAYRPRQPDRHATVVKLSDDSQFVFEIARANAAGKDHRVADAQLGDGPCRLDCQKQLAPSLNGISDCD